MSIHADIRRLRQDQFMPELETSVICNDDLKDVSVKFEGAKEQHLGQGLVSLDGWMDG